MRFEKISIENFRAIEHVAIDAANGSMIVIAGPNGCGKSCIFDAIRFAKSAYGGYEDNEWDHWFNEFQISRDPGEMKGILRNKQMPARISVALTLHEGEKLYLYENGNQTCRGTCLESTLPRQQLSASGDSGSESEASRIAPYWINSRKSSS